ncbi:hypothetical protein pb186bvf_006737 [Paramecium bursaria]
MNQLNEEDIQITIRANDNRQFIVNLSQISKREVIYHFKSKYFREELEQKHSVKFIYMGKILDDKQLISEINFQNGQIIQAYILEEDKNNQSDAETEEQQQQIHLNMNQALQEMQGVLIIRIYQQDEGTDTELFLGIFIGFVLIMFALIGICITNCSVKAKKGVMIVFVEIQLQKQSRQKYHIKKKPRE